MRLTENKTTILFLLLFIGIVPLVMGQTDTPQISQEEVQPYLEKSAESAESFLRNAVIFISTIFFMSIGICLFYIFNVRRHFDIEKEIIQKQSHMELEEVKELLERKNKELTALSLKLIEREAQLSSCKQRIKATNNELNHKELNQIVKSISINNVLNWDEFEAHFLELNDDFFKQLTFNFPKLTRGDLRLCALIKLNFSSKEIAQLSGVSVESIHTSRYRLRKKMRLSRAESLTDFIVNV